MKMNLLGIVQSVLSSMDSDSVNNIGDTVESLQVADTAREVYYELMSYRDWDHLYKWMPLEVLSDNDFPNYLRIPGNVGRVENLRYETTKENETKRSFTTLIYKAPVEFIDIVQGRDSTADNVEVVTDLNGVEMFIRNDHHPRFWTSFDDKHIVTDSYLFGSDDSLQESKNSAWCRVTPSWVSSDEFIPELPEEFFPSYLAEVKSTCHLYFKQQVSQKDEQKARRGLAHVQRKERFDRGSTWVRWGR